MPEAPPPDKTPIRRVYGRRATRKLRPGLQRRLTEDLPRLAVPMRRAADGGWQQIDPATLFAPAVREIWLEIGFGAGEHLAWQAAHNAQAGVIGCEPYSNGVASLLRYVAEQGLANVAVHHGDVRDVIDALPDASLSRAFILFPDPWPKRRHRDRRIVSPETLDTLGRAMADGGELRLASDDPTQIAWMLQTAPAHPLFQWHVSGPADWQTRPDDWPETRYEAKARAAGRAPVFLRLRRRRRKA